MPRYLSEVFIALLIVGWFAAVYLLRDVEYGLLGLSLVAIAFYFATVGFNRLAAHLELKKQQGDDSE